ncbi:MAG: polysaccharide deacetylase family protein [Coprococcus sp.]|nr:polysaccharide deacetylase family protein [Coprococcus sp.]
MRYRLLKTLCGVFYVLCFLLVWGVLQNGQTVLSEITENDRLLEAAVEGELSGESKSAKPRRIAITFDDGPAEESTPILLDGLKERGVKATFFVIGKNVQSHPELVKREAAEGHLIGNHTYHHTNLASVSDEKALEEIAQTSRLVEELTGERTEYVRAPFGAWKKNLEEELDVIPVKWSVDPLDWTTENEDDIVNKVVTQVQENDIILLHDCYRSSVNAALRIIDILQKEGYDFVTVDELLLD